MSEMSRQPADAEARRAALDPRDSFIVQAPAGSGKTELLTQRFLRLLATVSHPEEVLAITFTRKAAAEMRDRVLRALELAAGPAPAQAHLRVTWELGREVLARDTAEGWALTDYPNRLRIQTIDALNAMLTRQLPLDAGFGQPPELATRPAPLYREAALRALQTLEGDAAWRDIFRTLLLHLDNAWSRTIDLLAGMLAKRDQWLRYVGSEGHLSRDALEAGLAREAGLQLAGLRERLTGAGGDALAELAAGAGRRLAVNDPAHAWAGLAELRGLPAAEPAQLAEWQALANLLLTASGGWRKRLTVREGFPPDAREDKTRMSALLQDFVDDEALRHALAAAREIPPPRYSEAQWQILDALGRLLPLAVAELQLVFAARGHVDYAEMALRALQALGSDEAPTDLALYLDHRIRHLLVDEFQDTSVNQWALLRRLTAGWERGDGRSLFLVGDPMQSIYRFREAEVGLFLRARRAGLGDLALTPLQLQTNFRSRAGVVEWVNAGMQQVLPAHEDIAAGAVPYTPSRAWHPAAEGAAVHWHPQFGLEPEREAERIVALLQARPPGATNRTAILVRNRKHLAAILPALRSAGLSYQAVDLESLAHLPVIQDLFALTRAILNPADRTAWLAVLRSPVCGLPLTDLHRLAGLAEQGSLLSVLTAETPPAGLSDAAQTALTRVEPALSAALESQGRTELRTRVETAWLAMGGPAALTRNEDIANARLFFDLLEQEQSAGEVEDVNDLVEALAMLFAAPDPGAGQDLQVMTLHKAKGLEFDTVIMPGLGHGKQGSQAPLLRWLERPRGEADDAAPADLLLGALKPTGGDPDPVYRWIGKLEDEIAEFERGRLLYVGMTRAREQLHLLGHVPVREADDGDWDYRVPAKGSMLADLWELAEPAFDRAFAGWSPAGEAGGETVPAPPVLRRLPPGFRPALPAAGPELEIALPRTASEHEAVEFSWAGTTARHVGTVTHACLERIAAEGPDAWPVERLADLGVERRLARLGVALAERDVAAERVHTALVNALSDPTGRWLLDPGHRDASCELALSGVIDGELFHVAIDRSFVDAAGVRWIVDYKTSSHEGGDRDAFLAREKERYGPQMARYAALLQAWMPEPVRLGLYFPLLKAWVEWAPGDV